MVLPLRCVFHDPDKGFLNKPDLYDLPDLHLMRNALPKVFTMNACTYGVPKLVVYSQVRCFVNV